MTTTAFRHISHPSQPGCPNVTQTDLKLESYYWCVMNSWSHSTAKELYQSRVKGYCSVRLRIRPTSCQQSNHNLQKNLWLIHEVESAEE